MKKESPNLECFIQLVNYLGNIMGKDYEIALVDVSDGMEIISISNRFENRGDPVPRLRGIVGPLLVEEILHDSLLLKDGAFHHHILFIREKNEVISGLLIITHDITRALVAKEMIDNLLSDGDFFKKTAGKISKKKEIDKNIIDLLNDGVQRVKEMLGKPLVLCSKEEKLRAIKVLDNEGYFMLKGSVEFMAKQTGNTKYTIYSYLRSVRGDDNSGGFERGYL